MADDLRLTGAVYLDPVLAKRPTKTIQRWLRAELDDLYDSLAAEVEPWKRRVRKAEEAEA